jgi:hypothetical protein
MALRIYDLEIVRGLWRRMDDHFQIFLYSAFEIFLNEHKDATSTNISKKCLILGPKKVPAPSKCPIICFALSPALSESAVH